MVDQSNWFWNNWLRESLETVGHYRSFSRIFKIKYKCGCIRNVYVKKGGNLEKFVAKMKTINCKACKRKDLELSHATNNQNSTY